MSESYQSLSHSKWDCKYHLISILIPFHWCPYFPLLLGTETWVVA
jgi:hypothetical protein